MTYTNNVPQGNQTIAQTTTPIRNNFLYLDTALKVDHAFNGNEIGGQAPGTHQKISFPNQAVDIAALPAGIDAIQYCINDHLYSYNGNKRPVSGVSGTGSIALTNAPQSILSLTENCIGIFVIQGATVGGSTGTPTAQAFSFFRIGANQTYSSINAAVGAGVTNYLTLTAIGDSLFATIANGAPYVANYKYIYWPI